MAKLTRVTAKVFGENASLTVGSSGIGQFGSAKAGTFNITGDVATIQALPAWSTGFRDAVTASSRFPALEEMTGLAKVLSYQNAYVLQEGIPEWDSGTTYNIGSIVKVLDENDKVLLYQSIINDNLNTPVTNDTAWEKVSMGGGGGFEIGDIGIAPLGIDETKNLRRYANGQVIIQDQFVSFTNKLKRAVQLYPSLVCTEAQWQATVTLSVGGQCGKFVIDDVAGTIRLPKIIMPIQGLTNLANLAKIVEAGLPNITGTGIWGKQSEPTGAIYTIATSNFGSTSSGNGEKFQGFDASLSNSIYGNSSTVQQEQIQYPYFIQVATGVEESVDVTREIELNNPFCLLDYKYSEYELNNISWLRSNGQWNAKAVFPDAYDLLLKIYNGTETKAGVSVKLSTETYADTDFVLNTSDETFRLPLKVALASGKAVVGNGMSLGLSNGTQSASMISRADNYNNDLFETSYFGKDVGYSVTSPNSRFTSNNNAIGVTTDATKSGIELSDANLYLYFYVGETVQNANLINAGRIEEKLVDKADKIEVDGQWVNSYLELASEVTVPTSTNTEYDISSYLPNDTYDYEVMLTGYVTTGAATGRFLNLLITTDVLTNFIRVCAAQTRSSSSVVGAGCASVPVSTGRKIIVNAYTSYTGTYELALVAYRRLGTNQ